jgi:FtsH-binding integral membrane protein
MNRETAYQWRRQLMWGLLLIAFGIAVFLDQMDIVETESLWHYAPLALVVFGINKTIGYPTARDFTSGLWLALIGIWLFAVLEGMFGLTLRNSWPIFIIISGVTMALEPIMARRFNHRNGGEHEK